MLDQRELELEHESITKGIGEYYRKTLETPIEEQTVGLRLLKKTIEPLREVITVSKLDTSGNTKFNKLLNELDIPDYELAYIILKASVMTISENIMVIAACNHVATMVLDHHEYLKFKKEHPAYLGVMEKDMKKRGTSDHHKRTSIKVKKKKLGLLDTVLSHEDKLMLGQKCLDLLIQATGLFQIVSKPGHDNRDRWYFVPTEDLETWLQHQHELCELMSPFFLPMVVEPKDWTGFYDGGYYCSEITKHHTLVKTRNKDARSLLEGFSMPEVYSSINSIQKTAWRVNTEVLEVLQEVWNSGSTLGDLPTRDLLPLPAKPWGSDDKQAGDIFKQQYPDEFLAWKRTCTPIYLENKRLIGKRVNMQVRINMANKFKDEENIYYPHCLDFRGRVYPIPMVGGMHPQGDDSGKALLMFAEGKKLGERGLYWLMVHLANTYGFDKASFDDRVKWVEEHQAEILDSATNPLDGYRFWSEADSPYCFLAAAMDYSKALNNPEHVSHIPVAMDGSCNGLQHFSAMLRDEVGGSEVNLVPKDKPADIYSKVAAHVSDIVMQDAMSDSDVSEVAKLWVGKIDRKMAKRNVMTLPYGAKKFGFKDQLMAELKDREKDYLDTEDHFKPAVYLADRMYNGIGDIVIAARAAMDWLQQVSTVINQSKQPIHWITPAGFKAYQKYQVENVKQIDTFWGKLKVRIYMVIKKDTEKIDTRKQTTGISPNFVHSMDASALMLTVNRLAERGVRSFAMIHDSYGTHAADVGLLHEELREAFIRMYADHDVLEEFRQNVLEQLPEELWEKVPPVPSKGSLDLAQIRNSLYFFA